MEVSRSAYRSFCGSISTSTVPPQARGRSKAPLFIQSALTGQKIGEGLKGFEKMGDCRLIWSGVELEFVFRPLRQGRLQPNIASHKHLFVLKEDSSFLLNIEPLLNLFHADTVAMFYGWKTGGRKSKAGEYKAEITLLSV